MRQDEYLLKITILGEPELSFGLSWNFADGKFPKERAIEDAPLSGGTNILTKKIQIDNAEIKLILVALVREEFEQLRPSFYRGASAGIFVFDKGRLESFEKAQFYYQEFRKVIPDLTVPPALIGISGYCFPIP